MEIELFDDPNSGITESRPLTRKFPSNDLSNSPSIFPLVLKSESISAANVDPSPSLLLGWSERVGMGLSDPDADRKLACEEFPMINKLSIQGYVINSVRK